MTSIGKNVFTFTMATWSFDRICTEMQQTSAFWVIGLAENVSIKDGSRKIISTFCLYENRKYKRNVELAITIF
jgi:hypothetical protein